MKLSCAALGARVVVFLIVISQMDGGMVAARRGAFLSTGGAFKISGSSNRGGNTEESRRLGEGAKQTQSSRSNPYFAKMCPDSNNPESGCSKELEESYGNDGEAQKLAYRANYTNNNLAMWLESGGKMKITDALGYQELTTFRFAKDLLKEGELGDRLWKLTVSQSGMREEELGAPSVSYALMASSADGTPYNFLKLSLSGPKPASCKLDFGFRVDACAEAPEFNRASDLCQANTSACSGCCCTAGIVKGDTALNDPNPEDTDCTGWVLQAQGVAAAFANKWMEKHPEVKRKVRHCTKQFEAEADARARQSSPGEASMCGPPPPPYCDALDDIPLSFGGGGNSELDLDDAQEMEDFRV